MTEQSACGTEIVESLVMSTTPSECNGELTTALASLANDSVFDVAYTPTADFVLTASEDGNVRYVSSL